MSLDRVGRTMFGMIAVLVIAVAACAVWLFLASPVVVATTMTSGSVSRLAIEVTNLIVHSLEALLRYL